MNELSTLEGKLHEIWEKHKNLDTEIIGRKFCFSENIENNAVVFIGLNPSYNEKDGKEISKYELSQQGNDHPYFKKIAHLKLNGIKWTHLDLLFMRETNAKKIDQLLKSDLGVSFIWEQLQLSKERLENSDPKIIVIANTKARLFFGKDKDETNQKNLWLDYKFEFDETLGTHRIKTPGKLFDKPVFFTSMLSGQRAMDNGSFERLQWHINFVNKLISQ